MPPTLERILPQGPLEMSFGSPSGTPRVPPKGEPIKTAGELAFIKNVIAVNLPRTTPKTALDIWGPEAVRVHEIVTDAESTRGYLTVTQPLVDWTNTHSAIDNFEDAEDGSLIGFITADEHCSGHFGGRLAQYKPFPGHYIERSGVTIAALNASTMRTASIIPVSIDSVDFLGIVKQGETMRLLANVFEENPEDIVAQVNGYKGDQPIIAMKGVRWTMVDQSIEEMSQILRADEIDEAVIQVIACMGIGRDGLPLDASGQPTLMGFYKKIIGAKYHLPVKVGDKLEIIPEEVSSRMGENGGLIMGGARVLNQRGDLVHSYRRLVAGISPFAEAQKLFAQ